MFSNAIARHPKWTWAILLLFLFVIMLESGVNGACAWPEKKPKPPKKIAMQVVTDHYGDGTFYDLRQL